MARSAGDVPPNDTLGVVQVRDPYDGDSWTEELPGEDGPDDAPGDVRASRARAVRRVSNFRLTHRASLDGLRGLAVLAVVLFHTGHLTGGYLGVDLFFVLSGFLITSLLVQERQDTGTIALGRFWSRRARRLLPALFAVLSAVVLYALLLADPTELGRIRADGLATLGYVANWHGIAAGHGYWDQFGPPSPLQHTWSLAIEEQFYVVWPMLLSALLWWRRGSRRAVVALCASFAIAGAIWMAIQFEPDATDRAYLGTDTRIPALLIGAGLAAWMQWKGPISTVFGRRRLEVAAWVGVAWLAVCWFFLSGHSWFLYFGGMFLCGLSVAAILAAAVHPEEGPIAKALSFAPLGWLGLISYGLYLWHWPVIVVLSEDRTGWSGWSLTFVQLGLSVAIAVGSYKLLEMPIRRHGFAAWKRPVLMPVLAVVVVLALLVVTRNAVDAAPSDPRNAAADLSSLQQQTDDPVGLVDARLLTDKHALLPRPSTRKPRLLMVGDSVAWSLAGPLEFYPGPIQTVNRAYPACTLDRDSGRTVTENGAPRQEQALCREWPSRWADDVARYRPDAVLMIFGGLNGEPRIVDGEPHDMCSAFIKSWYRKELDDAFGILTAKGAVVYLAPFTYSNTTARPKATETADCLNPVIREAVAAHPVARLIELDKFVCESATKCRQTVDGVKLRYDGLHYREHAADVVNAWLLGQIFEPEKPFPAPTGPSPSTGASTTTVSLAPLPPPGMATVAPSPSTKPKPAAPSTRR